MTRMDDHQTDILIISFLSGKASEEECRRLEKWVGESLENKRFFEQVRNIWQTSFPAFDPASISVEDAEKKILRQIRKERSASSSLWVYWQRIAAILIIPLLLLSGYLITKDYEQENEEIWQELTAPFGMISQVDLPDGSKVWLNGGSSLQFPHRFQKKERQVSLTGEGYFEVESDATHPFVVETAHSRLVATGTAFNINAHKGDSLTAITLTNGIVDIEFGGSKPIRIQPGDHASFNTNTSRYAVRQTDPYKWYAWKDGLMVFRDDPLAYVFKRLEQTFNVEIQIREPAIADALYRATFDKESLNEILRLLELTAPIRFVYLDRTKSADNQYEKQQIEVHSKQGK
ncbi:DUF4974 domain-containing protein [Parabacteroides sp. OttesenSCG-928-K15]|nr:DUF4974 domain-containing protein [Parabacteroides sp. OttesenSCG-928-K15]